jgi:hypothetical protein
VFDFLSRQVMGITASPRQPGYDGQPGDVRRAGEREAPAPVVARPATAEDQVLLGGKAAPPLPPLPVRPSEPAETGNRIRDLLRRLRGQPRRSGGRRSPPSEAPCEEEADSEHTGQRFDRCA